MTVAELDEYKLLKEKLMGKHSFVATENTEEWRRFNELSGKWMKYYTWMQKDIQRMKVKMF